MHRFFLSDKDSIENNRVTINDPETVKHMSKVLRLKPLEEVEFIESKVLYRAKIIQINAQMAVSEILSAHKSQDDAPVDIDLFQCLPKGAKLELILQKNVELGANAFFLVKSKRCIVEYDDKDVPKKLTRYNRIILDACKQSKREMIPLLTGVIDFNELSHYISQYDLFIVLYENHKNLTLKKAMYNFQGKKIGVLVGPEGGFEESEIAKLETIGANIVTLGKRILRTETAGFVAITCIQFEMNAFE